MKDLNSTSTVLFTIYKMMDHESRRELCRAMGFEDNHLSVSKMKGQHKLGKQWGIELHQYMAASHHLSLKGYKNISYETLRKPFLEALNGEPCSIDEKMTA